MGKQSNAKVEKQQLSSQESTMYPVKERSVEVQEPDQQTAVKDGIPMYDDVWDKLDSPVTSLTSIDDHCDSLKYDTTDTVHSPDSKPVDKPQLPDKPAISCRPKLMPKPVLPRKPNIQSTMSVPTQPRVVDKPASDVPVRPIPRPRSRGESHSDMTRPSLSPKDTVFKDQDHPPEKPPRRCSTQCYSSSSRSDSPSPLGTRMTPSPLLTAESTANGDVVRPHSRENRPVLPPKPKPRTSSSSVVGLEPAEVKVADRLAVDGIDLAEPPYSSTVSHPV